MKELIGKTISAIYLSRGEHFLKFEATDNKGIAVVIIFAAEGGCCSESWFADFFGMDNLINHKVIDVEELPMKYASEEDNIKRSRQESDDIYGFEIKTDVGDATIAFRNSSNGYYGGWLNKISESDPDDNWLIMQYREATWRKIEEDFSA